MSTNSNTVIPSPFKGISNNPAGCIRSWRKGGRGGCIILLPVWPESKGNKENGYIILLRVEYLLSGVETESELESDSIFSGWSRSRCQSYSKFVNTATLITAPFNYHQRVNCKNSVMTYSSHASRRCQDFATASYMLQGTDKIQSQTSCPSRLRTCMNGLLK